MSCFLLFLASVTLFEQNAELSIAKEPKLQINVKPVEDAPKYLTPIVLDIATMKL